MRDLRRAVVVALLFCACLVITAHAQARPSLNAYRGLGAWVDIYDAAVWRQPEVALDDLRAKGVRTLYLETANYRIARDLYDVAGMNAFIEGAHARGMAVVAWYLPGFVDFARDRRRAQAAIEHRTPGGQAFDSFALDIESEAVSSVSLRNYRLRRLSQQLRALVGAEYCLGAIIPSPVGMAMRREYWSPFPYTTVAGLYDVILPMGYYTYHVNGYSATYAESLRNISIVRGAVKNASYPVHLIGGLAAQSSANETLAYVRAVRETGCLGGSLYGYADTAADEWPALRSLPANPRQRPSLPRALGYTLPLGNCPSERSHPKEVYFATGGQSGPRYVRFRLWDAQDGEVALVVNWRVVRTFPAGPTAAWTPRRKVRIEAARLKRRGCNVIGFVARGSYPDWEVWGVDRVSLTRR